MHVPDGVLSPAVCAGTAIVAATAVGYSLRRMRLDGSERLIPLTSMLAAVIFAGQMVNFPLFVAPVSGHLLGGVLAGVVLGPYAGCVAMTLVLLVQAVLFADGGLLAFGANVLNMAVMGAWGGAAIAAQLRRWWGESRAGTIAAAVIASYLSVFAAAALFCLELACSYSNAEWDLRVTCLLMVGVHAVIGIGEGVLTGMMIGFLQTQQPGLLELTQSRAGRAAGFSSVMRPVIAGLVVALAVAAFLGPLASSFPDGLEAVAERTGFAEGETSTPLVFSEYAIPLPDGLGAGLSVSLAGVFGTVVVAGLAWMLGRFWQGPMTTPLGGVEV